MYLRNTTLAGTCRATQRSGPPGSAGILPALPGGAPKGLAILIIIFISEPRSKVTVRDFRFGIGGCPQKPMSCRKPPKDGSDAPLHCFLNCFFLRG
jgi:hypothetical protein